MSEFWEQERPAAILLLSLPTLGREPANPCFHGAHESSALQSPAEAPDTEAGPATSTPEGDAAVKLRLRWWFQLARGSR